MGGSLLSHPSLDLLHRPKVSLLAGLFPQHKAEVLQISWLLSFCKKTTSFTSMVPHGFSCAGCIVGRGEFGLGVPGHRSPLSDSTNVTTAQSLV